MRSIVYSTVIFRLNTLILAEAQYVTTEDEGQEGERVHIIERRMRMTDLSAK